MITLEGADWANDWSVFSSRFDSNTFYQFHFYCWDQPTKLNRIDQYLSHRDRLKAPVWVGETGEKDNTIYWATTDYFEAHNIGWSFWPWKKMDTRNTPYSIKPPAEWDAVRAYSRGNEKPSVETARNAFTQLAQNIRLENCTFFPDVVNAMMRRIPGKVEAENYGHEGLNVSFSVQDPSAKAKLYRTSEPVPIVPVEGATRRNSSQAIQLKAQEWTAYVITSLADKDYLPSCMARSEESSTVLEISLDGHRQEITLQPGSWSEIKLKPIPFKTGPNRLKVVVKSGAASLDWFAFN
jgi:hypothetical protein